MSSSIPSGRFQIVRYDTLTGTPLATSGEEKQMGYFPFINRGMSWSPNTTTWTWVDVQPVKENDNVTHYKLTFPNGESVTVPVVLAAPNSNVLASNYVSAISSDFCEPTYCQLVYQYTQQQGTVGARFVLSQGQVPLLLAMAPLLPASTTVPPVQVAVAPLPPASTTVPPVLAERSSTRARRIPRVDDYSLGLYRDIVYELVKKDPKLLAQLATKMTPQELALATEYLRTHVSVAVSAPSAQAFNDPAARVNVLTDDLALWLRNLAQRQRALTGAQVSQAPNNIVLLLGILLMLAGVVGYCWSRK